MRGKGPFLVSSVHRKLGGTLNGEDSNVLTGWSGSERHSAYHPPLSQLHLLCLLFIRSSFAA